MKLFGHPIHIMLVHFPAALFPFDLVCSFLAFYTGDKTFVHASFYAMTGGVMLGLTAIAFGCLDLLTLTKEKPEAVKTAMIHAGINSSVIIAYTVLVYSQYKVYPELKTDGTMVLFLKALIIGLMGLGNYFGGSLILKYRVAVRRSEGERE